MLSCACVAHVAALTRALLAAATAPLCAALDGLRVASVDGGAGVTVHVRYATEHRAGLLLRGPGLCDRVTGTGETGDCAARLALVLTLACPG